MNTYKLLLQYIITMIAFKREIYEIKTPFKWIVMGIIGLLMGLASCKIVLTKIPP